jgi:hypothetical protein
MLEALESVEGHFSWKTNSFLNDYLRVGVNPFGKQEKLALI